MSTERFTVLQAEFETLSKRLRETSELSERQALIKESRKLIDEMDAIIQKTLADLQKKVDKISYEGE